MRWNSCLSVSLGALASDMIILLFFVSVYQFSYIGSSISLTEREKRITIRPVVFGKSTRAVELAVFGWFSVRIICGVLLKTIGG